MCAGEEAAISTKTYLNTLAVLHLMAVALESEAGISASLDELEELATRIDGSTDVHQVQAAADMLCDAGCIFFIARGPTMAAARQAGLTYMEGTRLPAQALAGGAYRHGPFELVDERHRCVFFIPTGKTTELLTSMATEAAKLGAKVVCITGSRQDELLSAGCAVISVPNVHEDIFPLSAATAQERLLDAVARRRGLQAGIFRYGQKITIRE
jgi:glucosamine--fructose-6-phosphate aminotransferase (isomerizing)